MLKNLVLALTASATLLSTSSFAQTDSSIGLRLPTQKGGIMLGTNLVFGEMGFGSLNSEHTSGGIYNVSVSPRVGYFIKNNLAIGGTLNANFTGNSFGNQAYNSAYNSQSAGVGVFARQYFGKMTNKDGSLRKTRFFVEGGANVNKTWNNFKISSTETLHGTANSATFYVMPGFNHFFTKNIALEGGLNLSHTAASSNVIGNANHLGFNLGLQFFMGRR